MMVNRDDDEVLVKGTATAFEVLEALGESGEATLTEIAERASVSKPGAYKHLTTLDRLGYVVKRDTTYTLGPRFLRLGSWSRNEMQLFRAAKPKIDELSDTTPGLTSLLVEDHGQGVYVYRAGDDQYLYERPEGETVPLHASAAGKAVLAALDESEFERAIDRHGLTSVTPNTVTDESALRTELQDIREGGVASDRGECLEDWHGVAYPITRGTDGPVGAVSVSGPVDELTGWTLDEEISGHIVSTVESIEVELFMS
ncbi:IclR family transcriptional regulator [Haloarcula salina]|uniref:IclR family transcriptional regulator n=1 Tax=Haloarcula salina TaxID=1429914 RepID=A0AA41G1H8_9EURY|nr:IclR family transcriptional regulator [Haloarcula salina]MBV0902675.1 IclR family transcriptional regulator [Haloarcula salina]